MAVEPKIQKRQGLLSRPRGLPYPELAMSSPAQAYRAEEGDQHPLSKNGCTLCVGICKLRV